MFTSHTQTTIICMFLSLITTERHSFLQCWQSRNITGNVYICVYNGCCQWVSDWSMSCCDTWDHIFFDLLCTTSHLCLYNTSVLAISDTKWPFRTWSTVVAVFIWSLLPMSNTINRVRCICSVILRNDYSNAIRTFSNWIKRWYVYMCHDNCVYWSLLLHWN